jgi:DNA end-binding protein Ku
MARTKKRARSKQKEPRSKNWPLHAFWSGSLTFGLVNVPVLVYPASRHPGPVLRMISPEGAPVERRFVCPRDGRNVPADEIVRGYELDDGSYVIVEDDELEAIEPQKTREIDLRQFIDLGELPPALLERGYYLTPLNEATKAYRLLAEAMEQTHRAEIATFVMREREYLLAIFAREGILCGETLRFHGEIRDPGALGLPEPVAADRRRVADFERSIGALTAQAIPRDALVDKSNEALAALIEKKLKAGRDLVRTDHDASKLHLDGEGDGDGAGDLLETIRRSLRPSANGAHGRRGRSKPSSSRASFERRGKGRR